MSKPSFESTIASVEAAIREADRRIDWSHLNTSIRVVTKYDAHRGVREIRTTTAFELVIPVNGHSYSYYLTEDLEGLYKGTPEILWHPVRLHSASTELLTALLQALNAVS